MPLADLLPRRVPPSDGGDGEDGVGTCREGPDEGPGSGRRAEKPARVLASEPEPESRAGRLAGRALRWGVTLGLSAYVLTRADLFSATTLISDVRFPWLALVIGLYVVDRIVAAYKWRLLFVTHGYELSLRRAINVYLESTFLGSALPSTIGRDLIRAGMVSDRGGGFSYSLNSVAVERLLGLLSMLVCAGIGLGVFARESELLSLASPIMVGGVVVTAVVLGAFVAFLLLPVDAVARWRSLPRFLQKRIEFVLDVRGWMRRYGDRRALLTWVFVVVLAQQYLFILIHWLLAVSLGLEVALVDMLWIWPLIMVVVRLPLSIMGFGVRETLLYELFRSGGLVAERGVLLGVASGLLELAFVGVGGVLVLFDRGLTKSLGLTFER